MTLVKRAVPRDSGIVPKKKIKPGKETSDEKLSLPTMKSSPMTKLEAFTWLLYGGKKIGKTSMLSNADRAMFLMTEPGDKVLSLFGRPVKTWRDFMGYVRLLEKDTRFGMVVVDLVDRTYSHCMRHVCARLGIDHPADLEYGKGWNAVKEEYMHWIERLVNTGKGVIFVSHSTEKEIKSKSGTKYDRIQPTVPSQAHDLIEGLVDLWFYYDYEGDDRVLTIQGNENLLAGHRLDQHFRTPEGKPLTQIHMGRSHQEAWKNLIAAFNNTYVPPREESNVERVKKTVTFKKKKK